MRGKGRGGREVADSDPGSNRPHYSGTETSDSQVGEWSCVETQT